LTIGVLSVLKDIPLVCTIHGLSTFPTSKKTLRSVIQLYAITKVIQKIYNCSGKIVGVSKQTSEYYSVRAKCPINTIYNGGRITGIEREKNDVFTIVHVGDISMSKGWKIEFDSFCDLKKKFPDKEIRFLCAGRYGDISESDIKTWIHNENLSEKDFQYLGIVSDVQNNILKYADVMLLLSVSEGLPMSIVEAMEMGIPVITTSVGGIPEVIKDGYNGYLIDRNESILCDKLLYILKHMDELKNMSINAKVKFQTQFCVDIMTEKYMNLYEEVCRKHE